MNEDASAAIIPALTAALFLACVGFEVERRRSRLRKVFGLLDADELGLVAHLDSMIDTGAIHAMPRIA